jgi:hypothetical protein
LAGVGRFYARRENILLTGFGALSMLNLSKPVKRCPADCYQLQDATLSSVVRYEA